MDNGPTAHTDADPALPAPREPHLVLVEAMLRSAREHSARTAGDGSRPPFPRGWETMWRDAVRRQCDLAGGLDREARRSVQSMVDQLTRLEREAGWFRDDPRLRGRAISETLLHCTRLGPAVPSRPAQLAWERQHGLRPDDCARLTVIAAAQDEWLAAWNNWAATG